MLTKNAALIIKFKDCRYYAVYKAYLLYQIVVFKIFLIKTAQDIWLFWPKFDFLKICSSKFIGTLDARDVFFLQP